MSSVVPPLNAAISSAVKKILGYHPMLVGAGIKTGMNIIMDNPKTVGSDMMALEPVSVMDGQKEKVEILTDAALEDFLLKEDDEFTMEVLVPDILKAPVQAGELVGSVAYYINGQIVDLFPVYTASEVKKIDLEWRLRQVIDLWQMGNIL